MSMESITFDTASISLSQVLVFLRKKHIKRRNVTSRKSSVVLSSNVKRFPISIKLIKSL